VKALYQPPGLDEIRQFLQSIHTIAVVGLSPKAKRPSHQVASALQGFGYRIIPVRPAVDQVLGERAYAALDQLAQGIDLVNVFRAPEHCDAIVDSCIKLKLPAIWLQDGVVNEPAAARAQLAGLFVVMDRCIYRDYINLVSVHGQPEG
jgi:predicted CoA-binding protein